MQTALYMFFTYSVLGCGIETAYAALRTRRLENRKTMLIMPMCPVYGLGALSIVLVFEALSLSPALVAASGVLLGSAVEYLYGYACECLFRVRLWDYSGVRGSLHGRINVLYSAFWGALSLMLVYLLHPVISKSALYLPHGFFWALAAILAVDSLLTCALLYRFGRKNGRMIGCPVAKRIA